jgi:hypothetical protein
MNPLYPHVFNFIKKLSKGRYDIPHPAAHGSNPNLLQRLSAKKTFFTLFPRCFCALSTSIPEELSIPNKFNVVSQVILFISERVAFLYSGIIKNINFDSTFCIAILI